MKPLAIVACLLLAGCSAAPAATPSPTATTPATLTMSGTLDLSQVALDGVMGQLCTGRGGYADLTEGAQVVVTDAAGKTVGLGKLGAGILVDNYPSIQGCDTCSFSFAVRGVPEGDYFGVTVTHRGTVQVARADVGHVRLTLG